MLKERVRLHQRLNELCPLPPFFVHVRAGAFGYFEVTHDITKYCKAAVFSEIGKKSPVAARFSTVGKG